VRVIPFRVAPADNGMYVVVDAKRDALVIDPSMAEAEVLRTARDEKLRVIAILNTHGHPDHIYANAGVKEATRARLAIHRADAYRLDPRTCPPSLSGLEAPPAEADDLIEEGPLAYLQDVELEALHTPGHTEGSTCFYVRKEALLFSGDVLFKGNVGRVDQPGGNARQMEASLKRVAALPPETKVFPGHGSPTTIGAERSWLEGFSFG